MPRTTSKRTETVVSARVSRTVRRQLDALAKREGVSRGEYAARILAQHVEAVTDTGGLHPKVVQVLNQQEASMRDLREQMASLARTVATAKSLRGEAEGAPLVYQAGVEAAGEAIAEAIQKGGA